MKKLEEYVRSIPDFPEPGIIFRDITTILQDADGLQLAIDGIQKSLEGVDYDIVVGPESRGFIFGVPVAYAMHKGFVPWFCNDPLWVSETPVFYFSTGEMPYSVKSGLCHAGIQVLYHTAPPDHHVLLNVY